MWYLPMSCPAARSGICRSKPLAFSGTPGSPDCASFMEDGGRRFWKTSQSGRGLWQVLSRTRWWAPDLKWWTVLCHFAYFLVLVVIFITLIWQVRDPGPERWCNFSRVTQLIETCHWSAGQRGWGHKLTNFTPYEFCWPTQSLLQW